MLIFPFPIFFTKFALFKKKNKTLAILIIPTRLGNLGLQTNDMLRIWFCHCQLLQGEEILIKTWYTYCLCTSFGVLLDMTIKTFKKVLAEFEHFNRWRCTGKMDTKRSATRKHIFLICLSGIIQFVFPKNSLELN